MSSGSWPQDEQTFKSWLQEHALELLAGIGIGPGHRVLDYGCNTGAFAIPAAHLVGPNGRVLAVDIDAQALATLRQQARDMRLAQVEVIPIDAEADSLASVGSPVDFILLYDVLQVISDPLALLLKLHGLLKPGGTLSVFPMHIGAERALDLATQGGLYVLQERWGMLLCFSPA